MFDPESEFSECDLALTVEEQRLQQEALLKENDLEWLESIGVEA